jgi:hypothetical protein
MMRTNSRFTLAGLAGLALTASAALAQPAAQSAGVTIRVAPDAVITVPNDPAAGFDAPPPLLNLQAPSTDARFGPTPGRDLVGDGGPDSPRPSAADTDTYFATKEFQDKDETIRRKGHAGAGQQFAGAGKAAAGNLLLDGIGALITGN